MKKKYETLKNIIIPLFILLVVFLSILANGPHPHFNQAKSDLSLAIMYNDLDTVSKLISEGADVNRPGKEGKKMYPLHFAVGTFRYETVQLLLEKGAKPNVGDIDGDTPLHYAVKGHVDGGLRIVKKLIESGADTSLANRNGDIPLHAAVQSGNPDVVDSLARAGKNINAQNQTGKTPLHMAIYYENTGTAETLLKNNADASIKDRDGNTPGDLIVKRKTYYKTKNREAGEYEKSLERLTSLMMKYGKG